MACLTTNINTHSEQYQENYRSMASLVEQLYTVTAQIEDGGGEKARDHQQKKGKLPVRERILALLDPGSSFLEIGQFAGWDGRSFAARFSAPTNLREFTGDAKVREQVRAKTFAGEHSPENPGGEHLPAAARPTRA